MIPCRIYNTAYLSKRGDYEVLSMARERQERDMFEIYTDKACYLLSHAMQRKCERINSSVLE